MYSKEDANGAIWWSNYSHNKGLICSGGAIGTGGEKFADMFFSQNPMVDIIQVHKHWPYPNHEDNDWILKYVDKGKPVGRNEYFDQGKLGLSTTKWIMEKSFEHGAQLVCYYGFRMADLHGIKSPDQEPCWKHLEFCVEIRKRLNG